MRWLRGLPRPCGVIAADDSLATLLIWLGHELGIAMPGEPAILGINNDDLLCTSVEPTLSSVIYDGQAIGHRAAALLDRLFQREDIATAAVDLVPSRGVRARQSTGLVIPGDEPTTRAIRFIRRDGPARPLRVAEVARHALMSRRTLITRFKKHLGRPPKEEIVRVRLERMQELLRDTDLPIKVVSADMGFESPAECSRFFRHGSGQSPQSWRQDAAAESAVGGLVGGSVGGSVGPGGPGGPGGQAQPQLLEADLADEG